MTTREPLATDIRQASLVLDGYRELVPGTSEFERLYVERPRVETELLREAHRADQLDRSFHWCFTGHTGAGKSTELRRILADPRFKKRYEPAHVNLKTEFEIHNLVYADLILAMAKGCSEIATRTGCPIPDKLQDTIKTWAKNVQVHSEEETTTRTEGKAGLQISFPFIKASEEVRSGGGKRDIIRTQISTHITEFVALIDQTAEAIREHTGRNALCVIDGLDHARVQHTFDLLNDHLTVLTLPKKLSNIFVIPLALLNTSFPATLGRHFSMLPNIKVFKKPKSEELDPEGRNFFDQLMARYVAADLLTEAARDSIFRLSAGLVRDMILNTSDACGHAEDAGASRVEFEHVEQVWFRLMRDFRWRLESQDYEVLEKIDENPYAKGIEGVPAHLHSGAVIFYPNAEGWFDVHPAVRRIMTKSDR
jgi:hypothetical protein